MFPQSSSNVSALADSHNLSMFPQSVNSWFFRELCRVLEIPLARPRVSNCNEVLEFWIDSLDKLEIVMDVEKFFTIKIADEEWYEPGIDTVGQLISLVESKIKQRQAGQ